MGVVPVREAGFVRFVFVAALACLVVSIGGVIYFRNLHEAVAAERQFEMLHEGQRAIREMLAVLRENGKRLEELQVTADRHHVVISEALISQGQMLQRSYESGLECMLRMFPDLGRCRGTERK